MVIGHYCRYEKIATIFAQDKCAIMRTILRSCFATTIHALSCDKVLIAVLVWNDPQAFVCSQSLWSCVTFKVSANSFMTSFYCS